MAHDKTGDDEPDWIVEQAQNAKREAARRQRDALEERLSKTHEKERQTHERHENGEPLQKRSVSSPNPLFSTPTLIENLEKSGKS